MKYLILSILLTSQLFADCELVPVRGKATLDHDLIWYRLTVKGESGKLKWRIPLSKTFNGKNDVNLSRIGYVDVAAKKDFLIDLNIVDINRMDDSKISIELEKAGRKVMSCHAPAEESKRIAKASLEAPSAIATSSIK